MNQRSRSDLKKNRRNITIDLSTCEKKDLSYFPHGPGPSNNCKVSQLDSFF